MSDQAKPSSKGSSSSSPSPEPGRAGLETVVVIGNFDGVHEGHRAVLAEAKALADELGLIPTVLTFYPHPIEVLRRGSVPLLSTLAERIERLEELGFRVHVEPFTPEFSEESPETFARELLVGRLGAKHVLVGEDFRFGRGRSGDLGTLTALGARLGFEARALELKEFEAEAISSSRIRRALSEGHIDLATKLLGRRPGFSGVVELGDQRGRTLGFPTANLGEVSVLLPKDGVYVCLVTLEEGKQLRTLGPAVMNLGGRPTVDRPHSVEVHILDFEGDLYGKRLRVEFVERLRDVMKFSSLETLKAQINSDVEAARRALSARGVVA